MTHTQFSSWWKSQSFLCEDIVSRNCMFICAMLIWTKLCLVNFKGLQCSLRDSNGVVVSAQCCSETLARLCIFVQSQNFFLGKQSHWNYMYYKSILFAACLTIV
ncbi:uncharacterized protein LOC144341904 [Saccoglossus kowalevskii]